MNTIQNLFQQAQLAEAAYANFLDSAGNVQTRPDYIIAALQDVDNGGKFPLSQATAFVAEWTVRDQFTATGGLLGEGSGFSGTLFQNKTGEYSLSLRGTQPGYTDLAADIGDILADGIALDQIVDLYNYWQSLTHTGTYQAKQLIALAEETQALAVAYLSSPLAGQAYEATLRANPNIIIDKPSNTVRTIQTVDSTQLSNALLQTGSDKLSGTAVVNVDGHSLGGHLAMAFSRLFPNATNSVVAVNGAGFDLGNSNVDHLFALLSGSSSFDAGKITNVVGSAAMDVVSQDWLFLQQPAGKKEIYTESWLPGSDTTLGHGSSQMTDSLAVYALFAKVDPASSIDTITSILNAASNRNANTLESALSALGWVYFKAYYGGETSRDAFYTSLYELQGVIGDNHGTVVSLTGQSREQIAGLAKTDIAYRHALEWLDPFVVTGNDSLYANHNIDGHLNADQFSDLYLQDRAAMLTWKMQFDKDDKSYDSDWNTSIAGDWQFTDMSRDMTLTIDGVGGWNDNQIIFGSSNGDTITGGGEKDHLYGGIGEDTIYGQGGDDHLEGNDGNDTLVGGADADLMIGGEEMDTYYIEGNDTIRDTGRNIIVYEGQTIAGAFLREEGTNTYRFLGDNNFTLTFNSPGHMVLNTTDSITFENQTSAADFESGDFGITLYEAVEAERTLTGTEDRDWVTVMKPSYNTAIFGFWGGAGAISGDNLYDDLGYFGFFLPSAPVAMKTYGQGGNDLIYGLSGSDYIEGGDGDDVIRGEMIYENLYGEMGNGDTLLGGTGKDVILGSSGKDLVSGGADNDFLDGLSANDTMNGDGGDDMLAGGAGDDQLSGGTGNDYLLGDASLSVYGADRSLATNSGAYAYWDADVSAMSLSATYGDNGYITSVALQGFDLPVTGSGNDQLFGGIGNDILLGAGGNDTLLGESDHDRLEGGDGDDYLDGGAGNDLMLGDDGADAPGGNDKLVGGLGDDELYGFGGDDYLDGGNDQDYLAGGGGNDTLQGGIGNDQLYGDSIDTPVALQGADTLYGGAGNDILSGRGGNDTYIFSRGDGQDIVNDSGGAADTIHFTNVSASEVRVIRAQANIYLTVGGTGDTLTLENWFLDNSYKIERLEFAGGTIWDAAKLESEIMVAPSSEAGDTLYAPDSGAVINGLGGDDDLVGGQGNDTLYGGPGLDLLMGNAGDDTLVGGDGNDFYMLDHGFGHDTVIETVADGDVDRIVFAGDIAPSDVYVYHDERNLYFSVTGTDDLLTLSGWFTVGSFWGLDDWAQRSQFMAVEEVRFADGTIWDAGYLKAIAADVPYTNALTLYGSDGADFLRGYIGDDKLYGGAGDDVLNGGTGEDKLYGDAGNDHLYGEADHDQLYDSSGNNVLDGGDGDDFLQGGSGDDTLYGGEGHDTLSDTSGNNTLDGGGGDDYMLSGYGNDVLMGGDGNDNLTDLYGGSNLLVGGNGSDYLNGGKANDSLIGGAGDDMLVDLHGDNVLDGGSGDDNLRSGDGNDILTGGGGSDFLKGGAGDDAYIFGPGFGQDFVFDTHNSDTIRFANGISPTDIILSRVEINDILYPEMTEQQKRSSELIIGELATDDLCLTLRGTGDRLVVDSWFISEYARVEWVEFADGTVWDVTRLEETIFRGTGLDDTLTGGGLKDVFDGKAGNDTIYGGGGDDVFLFGLGDGQDTIFEHNYVNGDGTDLSDGIDLGTIRFKNGVAPVNVTVDRDGSDLLFSVGTSGDAITVPGWFSDVDSLGWYDVQYYDLYFHGNDVGQVEFADGTVWTTADLRSFFFNNSDDGNNIILGTEGDNVLSGIGGDDYLNGQAGNDILEGGEGNDYLEDSAGNDILDGGAGNDALWDDEGNDVYVFGRGYGQDIVYSWDENSLFTDIVRFQPDVAPSDILVSPAVDGSYDLVLSIKGTDDTLTISGFFNPDYSQYMQIDAVEFADGTVWNVDKLIALASGAAGNVVITGTTGADTLTGTADSDTLQGGAGNDLLAGGDGDDTYIFNPGDGVDQIVDSSGTDTILFGEGITPDSLSLGLGSLLVRVGDQGDAIHLEDFNPDDPFNSSVIEQFQFADGTVLGIGDLLQRGFDIQGTNEDDLLTGTAITDRITGGGGNDTLAGGKGDDLLAGGGGDDTYVFNLGDGQDTIADISSITEGNLIAFGAGITASDLAFGRDGSDLLIQVGSQGDALRLKDFDRFGNNGSLVADTLQFADGSQASLFALTNTVPVVGVMPQNQTALEDMAYSFIIPADTFTDADGGDSLTYSATLGNGNPLPAWLTFDPVTRTFSGTPANGDVGMLDVAVMATDTAGASVVASFALNIVNVNDAPMVAAQIPAQSATEDAVFSFTIPVEAFTDIDTGDVLTYTASLADASALPSWLSFDAVTRTFSGTPENGDVGILDITVTATDSTGASVAENFAVEVINTNDAPEALADSGFVGEDDILLYSGNVLVNDSDVDAGTILSIAAPGEYIGKYGTLTIGADGGYTYSLNNGSGEVQAIAEGSTVVDQFIYNVSDGIVAVPGNLDITVTGANDAPVLAGDSGFLIEDLLVSASGNVLINDFDVDSGTTLDVVDPSIQLGRYGALSLVANGGYTYSLDNMSDAVQSLGREAVVAEHFNYTATDGIVNVGSALDITLTGSNDAPLLVAHLADQQVKFNKNFSWQMPTGSFVDPDQGDTLDYSATLADGSPLPSWLSFDAATQTFSGRAPRQVGSVEVKVTATDKVGATGSTEGSLAASDVFLVTVSHENSVEDNCNDGPGAPGRHRGYNGHRSDDRDDDRSRVSDKARKDGDDHEAWRQPQREQPAYLNASHWNNDMQTPEKEKHGEQMGPSVVFGRWLTMDLAVSRALAEKKTLSWLDERLGADTTALNKDSAGFLGSATPFGSDLFSLQAGHGQELKGFKGLGEGLRKVA